MSDLGDVFNFEEAAKTMAELVGSEYNPHHMAAHLHTGHGSAMDATIRLDPTAYIGRAGDAIWIVKSYDGEVLGIGGPQPERAWEAAAHYVGADFHGE